MTRFAALDLSKLPAPAALEAISFEAILDARMADYLARWNAARVIDPSLPVYDVADLETDPAKLLQETDGFRETLLRGRINDAVLATTLAYAEKADLDVVAATFQTARADGEGDARLRRRAQLAWENLSIGGSYGGYEYQARSTSPVELSDVAVYGHEVDGVASGEVRIVCLGANASGIPATSVLARVAAAVGERTIRKVNDNINVVAATPALYSVDATLFLRRGADPDAVVAAQKLKLLAFQASRRAIGAFVSPGSIEAILGADDQNFVYDIEVRTPAARIGGGPFDVPISSGARVVWDWA